MFCGVCATQYSDRDEPFLYMTIGIDIDDSKFTKVSNWQDIKSVLDRIIEEKYRD